MFNHIPIHADTNLGVIPVDYIANMPVLAAGNPSIPHFKDGSKKGPFYLNVSVPSMLGLKGADVANCDP